MGIQTGVRVRKRVRWVLTFVTLTFDLWPWPFVCITSFIGNNSWKFHDDTMMTMMGTQSKRCNGQTDRQTDRRTDGRTDGQTDWTNHRAVGSQLKMRTRQNKHNFPTFSTTFPWMKTVVFWFKYHWSLFQNVQLTICMSKMVHVMDFCWSGDTPLSEPMLTKVTEAYMRQLASII